MADSGSGNTVVIERTIDAPIDLVWRMWTDPAHFAEWYGPEGASIPEATMDVRVGGRRLICMEVQTPRGPMRMWFTGEYREVTAPTRLVYTESMCDEHGTIVSPAAMGMPTDHPETTTVQVDFHDADGRTRLVMRHIGIPSGSPGEMGWRMAFDKLATYAEARDV